MVSHDDLRNCLAWVLRTNHKKLVLLHFRKDGWKHSMTETSYLATGRDMILFHYTAPHDWMHWVSQGSQARWHKHGKKTSARAGRAGPSVSLNCLPPQQSHRQLQARKQTCLSLNISCSYPQLPQDFYASMNWDFMMQSHFIGSFQFALTRIDRLSKTTNSERDWVDTQKYSGNQVFMPRVDSTFKNLNFTQLFPIF